MLSELFTPVDIISVTRHNASMHRNNWHKSAVEQNYYLRGFTYLFVMFKPSEKNKTKPVFPDRRNDDEKNRQIGDFVIKKKSEK